MPGIIDEFVARLCPSVTIYTKLEVEGLELPMLVGEKDILCDSQLRSLTVELTVTGKSERDEPIDLLETDRLHLISQGQKRGTAPRTPSADRRIR